MPQSYFNPPNQGIQVGSAFMNSMMQSYNRALFMQADIARFKSSERRRAEDRAFREEGRERGDFITYSNLVKQDIASSLFSDTADTQLAPEYKRRFIDRIGTPDLGDTATPDLDFVGPPVPPSLTRIGKARFQATTFKGEPAYRDTKTGQHFKRSPFKPGIRGIGAKFKAAVPGIPTKSDTQAAKDIKDVEKDDKKLVGVLRESAIDRLKANESPIAREYLKNNQIDSLRTILKRFPQSTNIPGAWFDESRSPEDVEKGIMEYIDSLIDIGYSPAEALAVAEEEYSQLEAEEFPRGTSPPQQATPTNTGISRVGIETIPDPLGIR